MRARRTRRPPPPGSPSAWPLDPARDALDRGAVRSMITAADGTGLAAFLNPARRAGSGTVVFVHGYALDHRSWRAQRSALAGRVNVLAYDHRSHGASQRCQPGGNTLMALADDLATVVARAPEGPVVLVGHSMGGMTIQLLAARYPWLFGDPGPVVGAALVTTSADPIDRVDLGLQGAGGALLARTAPLLVESAARMPGVVEPARSAERTLARLLTRAWSFAGEVDEARVRFVAAMQAATPIGIVADFFPEFGRFDGRAGLPTLGTVPTLVVGAAQDRLTPVELSRSLAAALPGTTYTELDPSGHLAMIERPDDVTAAVSDLAREAGLLDRGTSGS